MRSSRSSPGKSAVLLAARALRNRGMDENSVSSGEMEDAMELEESLAGGRMTPIPSRDCPSSSKTRAPRFRQGESKENEDTDSESEGDATSRRQGGRAPTMNANYHSDEDEEATEDNGNRYDPKLSPAKLQENINQSVPDPVSSEAKGQVAEVTESETPTEDGSVITAQDTEQAAGDDTANSTSSQEESNDKTTSEKGKHSSPLPKKVVKPPEGLTTGQLMTWHARQAKMRNTQMKKMEAQTGSGQKGPTRQKQVSRKQTTKLQGSNASLGANNNTNNEIGDSRLKQSHSASLQAARTRPKTKTTVKPLPPEELILEKLRTMGPQSLSQKELIGLPARDLEVGERVYTEFPNGEKHWYWGVIVEREKKKYSRFFKYHILYDDGDEAWDVSSTMIRTLAEYEAMLAKGMFSEPPEKPTQRVLTHMSKREDDLGPPKKKSKVEERPYTPAELLLFQCGECESCRKRECIKCVSCINNAQDATEKMCCFQKMCRRVPLEKKIQPARGFPQEGWYFAFEGSARSEYQGLVLISPSSRKYFTVEAAKNHHKTALADLDPQVFYNYVGLEVTTATESSRSYHSHAVKGGKTTAQSKNRNKSSSQEDPGVLANHALIGKDFNQRWTTLDGQTKVIYGTVEACHDIGGDLYFSIRYKEASRDLVNTGQNVSGGYVPEVQQLPETITFGGCLEIDSSIDNTKSVDSPLRWIVPDMRYVDFEVANGERVPRLRMYVRGFELIFKVKQSEVAPNSGKGVFVSCRSMTGAPSLELKSGELIDIGVYAPLRRQDKKKEYIFLIKNFIHSFKCEEWPFGMRDGNGAYMFDITDDKTGSIHDIAKEHVPIYVNEVNAGGVPCVKAEHDPEGFVHYLIGHRYAEEGPFHLTADGKEMEILIDYGEGYENVRVRKDYSRLPEEEAEAKKLELEQEYMEYGVDFMKFNPKELHDSFRFIHKLCKPKEYLDISTVEASMLVALLLRSRAKSILNEGTDLKNEDCSHSSEDMSIEKLIDNADKLVKYLYGFWNSPSSLKDSLLSKDSNVKVLNLAFEGADFKRMSPNDFYCTVIEPSDD